MDHLFVFCGDGIVKDFIGGYSEYRSFIKDYEAKQKKEAEAAKKKAQAAVPPKEARNGNTAGASPAKRKLSWKEQRELEQLEKDIEELGKEKKEIEEKLSSGSLSNDECTSMAIRFGEVKDLLDEKEMRWLELSEL